MLMGRAISDRDYLVLDASPREFQERFPTAREVGHAFPVFIHDGREYAFPRGNGRACCDFGSSAASGAELMADLESRDLTINAIALPLPDYPRIPSASSAARMVIGHPRALSDLHNRILRPASATAMADDPLRVFRAARFAAQLPEFTIHPELAKAMFDTAENGLLEALAAERVGNELRKALRAARPGRFLRILAATGCLGSWFEEFAGAEAIPAGPPQWHSEDVLEHSAKCADAIAEDDSFPPPPADREIACWMAMVHDIGKVATPVEMLPAHHGHELRGEDMARALGQRLALPTRLIRAGAVAARHHMTAARYVELRPGTRVDLLHVLHTERVREELFAVVRADGGDDLAPLAREDLAVMLAVRLPESERDLGPESGEKLRLLRAQALAARREA
ncbi:tRNA nucleotidyltransferase (CCA-adding enzyme) [Desulfobaculum xiamenense]|uniref:tRNA nucleotidyltransferase (CCA-adding enzyme) n=2 Tax=Desulfobaculum xiamenense TaxID=995050 RepID=A0A846QIL0_9BACT|nr:tRNA nucleotidyltransferase (CCA-adding enzyme) [Desulfobaculum xiamenense]